MRRPIGLESGKRAHIVISDGPVHNLRHQDPDPEAWCRAGISEYPAVVPSGIGIRRHHAYPSIDSALRQGCRLRPVVIVSPATVLMRDA